jgi:hypothetical protein
VQKVKRPDLSQSYFSAKQQFSRGIGCKERSRAEFEAKLVTVWEEADECVDWLEYLDKVEKLKVEEWKVSAKSETA